MTKQELAQKIKSKYPQYLNVDDNELADKIIAKYPVYQNQITESKPSLSGLKENLSQRGEQFKDIYKKTASGEINPLQTGVRTIGTAIGGAGDVLFQVIKEGVKAVSPKTVEVIKGGVSKVGESDLVQSVAAKYSDWATRNPEQAKDLESTLNIASIIPIGKAGQISGKLATQGIRATEKGLTATGKAVGTGLQVAGTVGEKTGKTLVSAAIPPKDIAGRVLAYKAKTPLTTRFKQAMEGVEKAPITPADVVIKYNLPTVTRSGIGIKAKRLADDLFNNQVKPTLSGIKERVTKKEIFDGIQRRINEVKDISRRKSLQNAFKALSYDYANVSSWGVKTLDEIKSSMATRLPSKVWKGQEIAGDMNNIRKMFSDEARNIVRSKLPAQVVPIYDDYGALKEVMKMGEKAIQAGVNTNMIGLTGEVWRSGATPLLTGVGTGISKIGTALRKTGSKLNSRAEKLLPLENKIKNIKPGLSIEDVSKKPLVSKTDNLIKEAKKYKSAEEFIKKEMFNPMSKYEWHLSDNPNLIEGKLMSEQITPKNIGSRGFAGMEENIGQVFSTKSPQWWYQQLAFENRGKGPKNIYLVEVKNPSKPEIMEEMAQQSISQPSEIRVIKKAGGVNEIENPYLLYDVKKSQLQDIWNKAQKLK